MPTFSADEALVASAMADSAPAPPTSESSAPSPGPQTGDSGEGASISSASGRIPDSSATSQDAPTPDYREFDSRYKDSFTGLLYLGYLDEEFDLYGHRFRIATPTQAERLAAGPVIKEYTETITAELAYQAIMVAAYLQSIDGQNLPLPVLTQVRDNGLRDRFSWVTENLRRPVITEVFERAMILEDEVDATLDAMGKASGSPGSTTG